ncbi:hypothetical protein [Streptomyces mangrovi]|uniref:hypothetical protein n=1 Tax=Streptomyces mangrovi TaxID=1206892 RepID=UPI00399CAA56
MRTRRPARHRSESRAPRPLRTTRATRTALPAVALICLGLGLAPPAAPAPAPAAREAPGPAQTWAADLSRVDADDSGVRHTGGELRTTGDYGVQVLAPHRLDRQANRVRVRPDAQVPGDAGIAFDVRGRTGSGPWTEWREAGDENGGTAALPRAVTTVQVRLAMWDPEGAIRLRGLEVSADTDPDARPEPQAAAAYGAHVFATRIGLVGRTTANGHVIRENDRFVALPSRRGLSRKGGREYSVRVCGPARCVTAPVWDVGPWNIRDDYWNPSSVRQTFRDLPRGVPEAEAAYYTGYNGGRDGKGRRVLNPAGIDLADGTFRDVGLRDNGWVTVTYLWTGR